MKDEYDFAGAPTRAEVERLKNEATEWAAIAAREKAENARLRAALEPTEENVAAISRIVADAWQAEAVDHVAVKAVLAAVSKRAGLEGG